MLLRLLPIQCVTETLRYSFERRKLSVNCLLFQKCGPHEQCGPDFKVMQLSDDDRQFILDLHNDLRNQVAIGNETRGEQPPAANMNILVRVLSLSN
jgi:hypothetical protein